MDFHQVNNFGARIAIRFPGLGKRIESPQTVWRGEVSGWESLRFCY
jgi:hypothetical protein